MASLRDLVADLSTLPSDQTLYARKPWSPASEAVIADDDQAPSGFDYMLEVALVRDVVEVWSRWRRGRQPSADEAAQAVIHYATLDAYQPVEGD